MISTLMLILLSIELVVGLIINIKKIKSVNAKKLITWELEIYHSVTCILYFIVSTIVDIIEYSCSSIDTSFVVAINYVSPILKEIGINIILSHSLSVAIYKYYIIILKRPMNYNNKNMVWEWLLALIMYPIIFAILSLVRHIEMIILLPIQHCESKQFTDMTLSCRFKDDEYFQKNRTSFYIISQMLCYINTLLNICFKLNILETFLYFKIFRFMNR